jgi:hypothetical protein
MPKTLHSAGTDAVTGGHGAVMGAPFAVMLHAW